MKRNRLKMFQKSAIYLFCLQGKVFVRLQFSTFEDGIILRKIAGRYSITLSGKLKLEPKGEDLDIHLPKCWPKSF